MCGFAGFTNLINYDGTVLEKMMNRIIHRGPDDSGKFVNDDIALGFRRLSIIDLSEGNQPNVSTIFLQHSSVCFIRKSPCPKPSIISSS